MIHKLVSFPIRSLLRMAEKIQDEVDKELYNIPYLQQQLIQLHMMYEMEEIDEDLYQKREQELLERYQIAKKREQEESI